MHMSVLRDITKRKRTVEALEQRNRDLNLLNRVSQALTSTLDLQEVTGRLLRAFTETIGAGAGSIWLWDSERPGGLVCRGAAYPGLKRSLISLRLEPGEGIAGWSAQKGQSVIVPRVSDDPRFSPKVDKQIGFQTVSVLAVPLRVRDKVIGVLEAVNKLKGEFDTHDLALIETLAPSAAIALENARLVEVLRQQALELRERNQDLDAFAHSVAHDLKTPLSLIIGYAELSKDLSVTSEEELRRNLQMIAINGRKMGSIIGNLLWLAEVSRTELEISPLDMDSIVAEAQRRLAHMVKDHQARVSLPPAWPQAMGYAPAVEEVWVNYLSNALKYGGQPPQIALGAQTQPDGMVRFWVRDNGPGIAPEDQVRLFTPFERLDQTRAKGHGLGLSIVKRIVEKLGGQVGVESKVGQGSVFSFTLPAAPV
jgi:signal transduction histidine kinase